MRNTSNHHFLTSLLRACEAHWTSYLTGSMRFFPATCFCQPSLSVWRRGYYKTQSINWSVLIKTPPGLIPSYHATHQPRWTKVAFSHCLVALLYMSQDALSHLLKDVCISSSAFLYLSLTLPSFPLVICFSPVGFGIPFSEHIIQFLSLLEDGPRAVKWVTVGPHTPTPHQPSLLSLPCDDVMAFICSGGTRWVSWY